MGNSVSIVGKGKAGRALEAALRGPGVTTKYPLMAVHSARLKRFPKFDSDVVIIAAKDDAIDVVSRKVLESSSLKLKVLVHLAGSRPSTILATRPGVLRLTLHPIQTLFKPSASLFHKIYWMASSDDPAAIGWARKFVKALGGKGVIVLPGEALPLYHAMTVFSSNFVTLLGGAIEDLSGALDQNPTNMKNAIRPLMEQAMENVLRQPAGNVLTGPIKRGDLETVRRHQEALKAIDPKLRKLYDAFLEFSSELTKS